MFRTPYCPLEKIFSGGKKHKLFVELKILSKSKNSSDLDSWAERDSGSFFFLFFSDVPQTLSTHTCTRVQLGGLVVNGAVMRWSDGDVLWCFLKDPTEVFEVWLRFTRFNFPIFDSFRFIFDKKSSTIEKSIGSDLSPTSVQPKFDWGLTMVFERFDFNCWSCDLTRTQTHATHRHTHSLFLRLQWGDSCFGLTSAEKRATLPKKQWNCCFWWPAPTVTYTFTSGICSNTLDSRKKIAPLR
jgi:hypothetical protein